MSENNNNRPKKYRRRNSDRTKNTPTQNNQNNQNNQNKNTKKDDPDVIRFIFTVGPKNQRMPLPELNAPKQPIPILCPNPLCDHDETATEEYIQNMKQLNEKPIVLDSINDIIYLGKKYHCKKNREYFGINLEIMARLVGPLYELDKMVGMSNVKTQIVNQIIFFLQNLNKKSSCGSCLDCDYGILCKKISNDDMLHTVITGPPGVGKTELGKILGKVYKAMGVLSNGNFNIATRSDLIGKYLGHTASKTQDFIDSCKGGVMFIDEAYSLGNDEGRDSFSKECIDTINQNLTDRRDFLCIIAGYKKSLEDCFFSYNDGLRRRFSFRYDIEEYTPTELASIFISKVWNNDWKLEFDVDGFETSDELKIKMNKRDLLDDFFEKNKESFPNFGGDVETLLLNCKIYHAKRILFEDISKKKILTLDDIEGGVVVMTGNRKVKKDERSISQRMMYM